MLEMTGSGNINMRQGPRSGLKNRSLGSGACRGGVLARASGGHALEMDPRGAAKEICLQGLLGELQKEPAEEHACMGFRGTCS